MLVTHGFYVHKNMYEKLSRLYVKLYLTARKWFKGLALLIV